MYFTTRASILFLYSIKYITNGSIWIILLWFQFKRCNNGYVLVYFLNVVYYIVGLHTLWKYGNQFSINFTPSSSTKTPVIPELRTHGDLAASLNNVNAVEFSTASQQRNGIFVRRGGITLYVSNAMRQRALWTCTNTRRGSAFW